MYKGCRRLYEAGVQGKGARVLPAGAGQGSVWGSPAGARQTPIPEHCGHSALPYPEHLRGHGFLEVQDRDRFRHEEDDRRAARRGQARACVLELSLATCWSRTTASQAGTGDLEFQGASSPVSAVELGLIPVAPSSRSCQRPKSERPLIREKVVLREGLGRSSWRRSPGRKRCLHSTRQDRRGFIPAGPPPQVQCKLPLRAVELSCPRVFGEVGRSPQEGEAADISGS